MSRNAALSAKRVRYSVRNCWSTEMPNRYSLVAPNGIPSVTTENAEMNTGAASRASHRCPRRNTQPVANSPPRQPTWPTVVNACS